MGAIARNAANNVTTSGVVLKGAVNNDSFDNVTALPSAAGADGITLISSQTASSSASISFTTGIDSTYKAYKFVFSNIHPATDNVFFQFQGSTDGGSNYGVTTTTTYARSIHNEADDTTILGYDTDNDIAQSTSFFPIMSNIGNENIQSGSGTLTLFNPSSTTFVKHFISDTQSENQSDFSWRSLVGGYFNTTSAINAVQFKFASGNIDAGTIYMYGIK